MASKKELKKKIENLHTSLNKKDEKIKFQKIEISNLLEQKEELKEKLKESSGLVCNQIIGLDTICSTYERQLDIQDKEIARQQTIIHYLEQKCFKGK